MPTWPAGSAVVATDRAGATVIESFTLADSGEALESVAMTVKLEVPAEVGVPVMAPLASLSPRPVGRDPPMTAHPTGEVPPVDVRAVPGYGLPTSPPGSDVVVMFSGTLVTAIDRLAVAVSCVGLLESVAVTAKKLTTPGPVGVPVMVPVLVARLSPGGREPPVTAQLTGAVPPVEARVAPG